MDVLPLRPDHGARPRADQPRPGTAEVHGTYRAADGRLRDFSGWYRLERLLLQFGEPAAAGVFSGQVEHASGGGSSVASRRQTSAAQVVDQDGVAHLLVGPVDVPLLGLTVAVDEFTVAIPLWLVAAPVAADPGAGGRATRGLRLVDGQDGRARRSR